MAWYWPFSFSPQLDWLQVEISTHCTAACFYCPRTLYKIQWLNHHMDEELFRRLLPVFRKTRLVHLQGWGDPFTHPKFFHFARLAKSAGCQVGTTTNGMLLNEQQCEQLVEQHFDIIGFSLAGVGAENDQVRRGTRLSKVLSVIETIDRIKQRTGTERPTVHIAYMLLKSGLRNIHRLPDLLRDRGISQVVISTLDTVGSPSLTIEALLPETEQEKEGIRQQLENVVATGRAAGLSIHFRFPELHKQQNVDQPHFENESLLAIAKPQLCTENIQRAAFVGVTGNVSPCVFVNLPITELPQGANPIERPYRPVLFGNVEALPFAKIWHSKHYSSFRSAHQSGRPPAICQLCTKISVLSNTDLLEA
ncbi:radical SAM protein [uncultured Desulfobulbus sp.]|uniref:radical SAM/SPASM domain-containing protein n=1 Tax=uncultured Desulfobulbus sp. TaxID=239745 RepID=UPI0029C8569B|nr:radical SAM protein [uncultured Desulfobulbus sp.]